MNTLHRLLGGTALALVAQTGAADITADDVWTNQIALAERTGATVSANQSRQGAALAVTDIVWDYTLPMDAGRIVMGLGNLYLTENGDGTVDVSYGDTLPLAVSVDIPAADGFDFEMVMDVVFADQTTTASGVPGNITYEDTTGKITISVVSFDSSMLSDTDDFGFDFLISIDDSISTSRITEGELLTFVSEGTTGQTITDFSFEMGPDVTSRAVSATGDTASSIGMALPAGPIDVMNLSQALRDGLMIRLDAESRDIRSQTIAMFDAEMVSDQSQTAAVSTQRMVLDASGFSVSGLAEDVVVDMPLDAAIPFPLNVAFAAIEGGFTLPLNSGADPQPYGLSLRMNGLAINEDIWALFDPLAQLPRDPVDFRFDIAGTARVLIDLLDIEQLVPFVDGGGIPAEIVSLDRVELGLNAVGAAVDGNGSFVFDNTDMMTFGGLPKPVGSVTVNAAGVNALIDRIVAMGFISADEVMMPRMMIGMFARATGDDTLSSTIEFNDEGHIIANGQRIQ